VVTTKKLPGNFLRLIAAAKGPIISASRRWVWNKQLKRYVQDKNPHGSILNYDGKVTQFSTQKQYEKAVATEWARWHYYKFFSQYGFKPEEWK
jgi:hypothetical protein